MRYELSEDQRHYVIEMLIDREAKLCKKVNLYRSIRKSERGLSKRQINNEKKVIDEMSLIHTIFNELNAI